MGVYLVLRENFESNNIIDEICISWLRPSSKELFETFYTMKLETTTRDVYGGYNYKVSKDSLLNTYKLLTHLKCNKNDMKIKKYMKIFCKKGIDYCNEYNVDTLSLEYW